MNSRHLRWEAANLKEEPVSGCVVPSIETNRSLYIKKKHPEQHCPVLLFESKAQGKSNHLRVVLICSHRSNINGGATCGTGGHAEC